MRIAEHVDVSAPPGIVWAQVSDPARVLDFFAGVTRWQPAAGPRVGLGARYRTLMRVGSAEEAIAHVNAYGSGHSEAIVTNDRSAARAFQLGIDSACIYVNASTRFTDGGEFGMGAEIGISTGKLHARGPVGAEQLTSYKYVVRGSGQVRP